METDTDSQWHRRVTIVLRVGSAEDRDGAVKGAGRGPEDDIEGVALGLYLSAVVAGDLTSDERSVFAQQPGRSRVALRLDVARVVTKVGEEERAGGGRRLAPDRGSAGA